ncbi:MAG: hypothetical protein AAGE85_09870 [Pseudomonadota bacterium]
MFAVTGCIQPIPHKALPECDVCITVSPTAGEPALSVEVRLSEPVAEYRFEPLNKPQRSRGWTVPGDEWQFDGELVSRTDGQPFNRFVVRLKEDERFFDRRYVAVDRVGDESWLLFLGALAPATGSLSVRFERFGRDAVVRDGRTVVPVSRFTLRYENDDRLIYVGSRRHFLTAAEGIVAGSEAPTWLTSRVSETMNTVLSSATEGFGVAPSSLPTVYVTSKAGDSGAGYKGGVLSQGVMAIRLRGIDLDAPDEDLIEIVNNTVAHEAVHFWIGQDYPNADEETQSWLHEGSTEYLADRFRVSGELVVDEAETRLNACRIGLGDLALDGSRGPVHGSMPYDCGYAMNFFAEIASLRAGNGDIAAIWRRVLQRTEAPGFTAESFLAVANEAGENAADDLFRRFLQGKSGRRSGLDGALRNLGIETTSRLPDRREGHRLRLAVLMPLLGSLCKDSYGFMTFDDHIKLDTGKRCGNDLEGDPEIVRVGEYSILEQPYKAYLYSRTVCGNSGALALWQKDAVAPLTVPCNATIELLPELLEFTNTPGLPPV